MTDLERFMSKMEPEPNSGCWLWLGAMSPNGYGSFRYNGKTHSAHRAGYMLLTGSDPGALDLDHKCRVRHCVNPDHLEPVTRQINLHRSPLTTAGRSHCPRGHLMAGDNILIIKTVGTRRCRECEHIRDKKRQSSEKRKESARNRYRLKRDIARSSAS